MKSQLSTQTVCRWIISCITTPYDVANTPPLQYLSAHSMKAQVMPVASLNILSTYRAAACSYIHLYIYSFTRYCLITAASREGANFDKVILHLRGKHICIHLNKKEQLLTHIITVCPL